MRRAAWVANVALLSAACRAEEPRSNAVEVTVASVSNSATQAPSALEREPPRVGVCPLPATAPADFGIKIVRHVMPHGREDYWEGQELFSAGNHCPANPKDTTTPCKEVDRSRMAKVYATLLESDLCGLSTLPAGTYMSPHYGSRSITVYLGGRELMTTDSVDHLLDERSKPRFYQIIDQVVAASP
ncbi:MAG: hypothetical protein U0271_33685 [Polyangiaceae bacterium]